MTLMTGLLAVVGVLILVAAFAGGGWALFDHARRTGSRPLQFLGLALMGIAAYGLVAAVVAVVTWLT